MSKTSGKNTTKAKPVSPVLRSYGRFGTKDFLKLARNSYAIKKYSRAIDNCRLAVDMAIKNNDNLEAAEAFNLWINILLEEKKYSEVKKVTCDARSKLGNYPELLYYEFKASLNLPNISNAIKLGREFIQTTCGEMADSHENKAELSEKIMEVKALLAAIEQDSKNCLPNGEKYESN